MGEVARLPVASPDLADAPGEDGAAAPPDRRRNSIDSGETLTFVTPAARWRLSSSRSASRASAGSITERREVEDKPEAKGLLSSKTHRRSEKIAKKEHFARPAAVNAPPRGDPPIVNKLALRPLIALISVQACLGK
jgi:hypothetical protein